MLHVRSILGRVRHSVLVYPVRRFALLGAIAVLILAGAALVISPLLSKKPYDLGQSAKLLTNPNSRIAGQLTYDKGLHRLTINSPNRLRARQIRTLRLLLMRIFAKALASKIRSTM